MVSSSCCIAPRAIKAEDSQLERRLGFFGQDFGLGAKANKQIHVYIYIFVYISYAYIYIYIYLFCVFTFTYNIWNIKKYYIIYVYTPKKYDIYTNHVSKAWGTEKLMNLFHSLQTLTISAHMFKAFFFVFGFLGTL